MRVGRIGLALVVLVLATATSVRAEDLEAQARQQSALYERHRDGSDWRNVKNRQEALRRLGELDTLTARTALYDVIRQRRPVGDQLVALGAIGSILDADTAADVVKTIGRNPQAVYVETLVDALAQVTREDAKAWLVQEGLEQKRPELLFAVTEALARLRLPDARERLTAIYEATEGTQRRVDLAYAAVRALGRIGAPESRALLHAAAAHRDVRIRLAAADVLALQPDLDDEDLERIKTLLHDEQPVVVRSAIGAVAAGKVEPLVGELAWLLGADRLRTRFVAHEALVGIAGRDLGWVPGPWQRWVLHKDDATPPGADEHTYDFGTYYGFDLFTDRIVFIVDISGSMTWPFRDRHPKRFVAATRELARTLEAISKDTHFNILAFNDKVKLWMKGEQKAERKTVKTAVKWIQTTFHRPGGETNTYGVLEQAFEDNPEADTIFLLSDGAPNGGEYDDPAAIVASVKRWNRYRRTAINTIALTLSNLDRGQPPIGQDVARMERLMRDLAAVTGGRFELVDDVPVWMRDD